VRTIAGWGDRIATMVLGVAASGNLLDIVLIFKGKGNIRQDETNFYNSLKNVHVIWQENAWIDAPGEKQVLKLMIIPYVKAVNEDLGEGEFLLAHDRGPGHDDECDRITFLSGRTLNHIEPRSTSP
jgi:hypothetical protein